MIHVDCDLCGDRVDMDTGGKVAVLMMEERANHKPDPQEMLAALLHGERPHGPSPEEFIVCCSCGTAMLIAFKEARKVFVKREAYRRM